MKKEDFRKNRKLTISINLKDMERLEDLTNCIPLCQKHKPTLKMDERKLVTMYFECKDCAKVNEDWVTGARRINTKLYEKYFKKHNKKAIGR